MSQQLDSSPCRSFVQRLSEHITVLAVLLAALFAPNAFASTACGVVYTITPQNSSTFGAAITINNSGTTALSPWTLTWSFANGQTITSSWNGTASQSGANVTINEQSGQSWQNIPAGGSYSGFGFNGTWNGATNAVPTNFAVNGVVCGGSATLTSTTTSLSSSATSTTTGTSVTLTAKVAPSAATGTVTFYDGTTALGTGTLSAGTATLATSFSTAGTHSITAAYGGSTTDATSTSSAVSIAVTTGSLTATTTTLSSSTTTPTAGASFTLTASVAPSATGTVTFYNGSAVLGTGTLSSGKATLSTSVATAGTYSLTAAYGGSTTDAASTSSAVSITVTASSSCSTTNPIVPYIAVGGVWSAAGESSVSVASGSAVDLGPWPVSGGSWAWTGPNGFTSTAREIDDIALSSGVNTYTATYTITGCSYKQTFTVTVSVTTAGQAPCDIFSSDGHACVAAYSTTRALFGDYQGHLYQVHRTSDNTYLDISVSSAGGHANAAAQNTFCANTTCTITKLYDQTTDGNDLSVAGPGANVPTADSPVSATALSVTLDGNQVYGMYFNSGNGYRNDSTKDIPVNADPEGAYMVTSGTHFNQYCCFDFGNAEVDNGYASNYAPSHMDAINFGSDCWFDSCPGSGPWVQVDLECCGKLGAVPTNSNDTGLTMPFVAAYLRNEGVGNYYLDGGDATKATGNASLYAGPLPSGYSPMHQEGAILLGIGGDNSDWGVGNFFEGAITAGVYSNAALNSIQANIAAAQYALK